MFYKVASMTCPPGSTEEIFSERFTCEMSEWIYRCTDNESCIMRSFFTSIVLIGFRLSCPVWVLKQQQIIKLL